MKTWTALAIAVLFAFALSLSGCAQMLACKTDASYILRPDGSKEIIYSSCKEQIGLEATFGDAHLKVDKSGTQESVIAALAEQQKALADLLKTLAPLLKAAGMAAGVP